MFPPQGPGCRFRHYFTLQKAPTQGSYFPTVQKFWGGACSAEYFQLKNLHMQTSLVFVHWALAHQHRVLQESIRQMDQ